MPNGNRYESTLERDLMLLMEFDRGARVFHPQPLKLSFVDGLGVKRQYTPDGLIEWHANARGVTPAPLLVEVKYREAFRGEWRQWRRCFRAASDIASSRGWQFAVFTEREIRTPLLDNAKLLLPFVRGTRDLTAEGTLLLALQQLKSSTPRALLAHITTDSMAQARLMPVLWRLLAERKVGADLGASLGMQSAIWTK